MPQVIDVENVVQLVHFDEELAKRIWKPLNSFRSISDGCFNIDDPTHGLSYWVVLEGRWQANAPSPLFRSLEIYIQLLQPTEFKTGRLGPMHEIAILEFQEIENVDYCESEGYIQFNLGKGKNVRIFGKGYLSLSL